MADKVVGQPEFRSRGSRLCEFSSKLTVVAVRED